ncbi:MAG: ribose 5-phosphate isomerase B [Butyrivibrio sp.]
MISIGCDHGGYDLKQVVMRHLEERGLEYKDFGCYDKSSCDYPEFGRAAAMAVAGGECDKGIVICTTGIGISIAANKVKGIRCALCTGTELARMTRLHNDANMLALGASAVSEELAVQIVDVFLDTEFSGEERHKRRVNMIEEGL